MANQTVSVGGILATLSHVRLPMGLVLDSVEIRGSGLRVQTEPFDAQLPEPARVIVTVSESALAAFLEKSGAAGLHSFRVEIADGRIVVHATKTVLIELRAKAVARLAIADGKALNIELESVELLGGAGLTNLVRQQVAGLNPIFDAAELPFPLTLESVEATDGVVRIFGQMEPPQVP
ncbi:MAG: DUF2993 domain-containing protein [Fimbriimonadaceae bacterium]|nr:DUF2993 domain-containing protein [Fimbriimonadaceae bacterium]